MAPLGNYVLYNIIIAKVKYNLRKSGKFSKKSNHSKSLANKDMRWQKVLTNLFLGF
jgi:hypothetical protein